MPFPRRPSPRSITTRVVFYGLIALAIDSRIKRLAFLVKRPYTHRDPRTKVITLSRCSVDSGSRHESSTGQDSSLRMSVSTRTGQDRWNFDYKARRIALMPMGNVPPWTRHATKSRFLLGTATLPIARGFILCSTIYRSTNFVREYRWEKKFSLRKT